MWKIIINKVWEVYNKENLKKEIAVALFKIKNLWITIKNLS